ncbi:hypothetical protein PSPO01_02925 [Paraphaeosphaeria sporulosa]
MPPSAERRGSRSDYCTVLHGVSPAAAPKGYVPSPTLTRLTPKDTFPSSSSGAVRRYLREHPHQAHMTVVTRTSKAANCIVHHKRRYLAPRPSPYAIRRAGVICVLFASYHIPDTRGTRGDRSCLLSCYQSTEQHIAWLLGISAPKRHLQSVPLELQE